MQCARLLINPYLIVINPALMTCGGIYVWYNSIIMKCPVDGNQLVMSERQGVEIDYCPECRGVWLDRGELDKIIDKNDQFSQSRRELSGEHDRQKAQYDDRHNRPDKHSQYRKKKESFLGEFFDF